MPTEPIRDLEKLREIQSDLREQRRLRDLVVFTCGISWALRASDLLSLTVGHVDNGEGLREYFSLQQKKTGRAVRVDITSGCRETLSYYLHERPNLGGHLAAIHALV